MSSSKYKNDDIRFYIGVYVPNELVGSCHPIPECLVHLPKLTEYDDHGVMFWYITGQKALVSELENAINILSGYGYTVTLEMM